MRLTERKPNGCIEARMDGETVISRLARYEDIGEPEELEHAINALDRIYKAGYSSEVAKVRINGRLFAVRELAQ